MTTCDASEVWAPYRVLIGYYISESCVKDHTMIYAELEEGGIRGHMADRLVVSAMVATMAINKMMEVSI